MVKREVGKKAIEMDMLIWIMLAILVLTIGIISIVLMKGKGGGAIDFIKNLFRTGG